MIMKNSILSKPISFIIICCLLTFLTSPFILKAENPEKELKQATARGDTLCNFNRLIIFNRWNKKVFESEGNELKWGGTTKGNLLNGGVYFYVLAGEDIIKSGSLTLLR